MMAKTREIIVRAHRHHAVRAVLEEDAEGLRLVDVVAHQGPRPQDPPLGARFDSFRAVRAALTPWLREAGRA